MDLGTCCLEVAQGLACSLLHDVTNVPGDFCGSPMMDWLGLPVDCRSHTRPFGRRHPGQLLGKVHIVYTWEHVDSLKLVVDLR